MITEVHVMVGVYGERGLFTLWKVGSKRKGKGDDSSIPFMTLHPQ